MSEIIKLNYPIECNGETINEITLRRPKAKDLKNMEKHRGGDATRTIHMVADLTGLDVATIEELDGLDFSEIDNKVQGFLGLTGDQ